MNTYNFNPVLKGVQEAERAFAAAQMIGNGTIAERAYAMTGATASTVAYITQIGVTSVAEMSLAQKVKLATMSLKEQTAVLWAQAKAWAATPFGIITIAITAIYGLVKAYDYLSHASDRAVEKHHELAEVFEKTNSEIETLENELETAKRKLEELSSVDSPELVDDAEITKLETSINLLETQLSIKRKLAEYQKQEAAAAAAEALTTRDSYLTGNVISYDGGYVPEFGFRTKLDEIEDYQNQYSNLVNQIANAYDELNNLDPGTEAYENMESQIKNLEARRDSLYQDILLLAQDISDLYSSLVNDDLTAVRDEDAELVARIKIILEPFSEKEEVSKSLDEVRKQIADVLNESIPKDFEQYEEGTMAHFRTLDQYMVKVQEYKDLLASMSADELTHISGLIESGAITSWDDATKALTAYRQATIEADYNARVLHQSYDRLRTVVEASVVAQQSANEVFADKTYITEDAYNAIVELVGSEEDLAECIDTSNGYLVTNSKELNKLIDNSNRALLENIKLAESHEKLNYHELTTQLHDLVIGTNSYDSATMASINSILKQIDVTKLQIAQYALLEQQLLGVTNAFTEYENAQAIDSAADYTDDLSDLISGLLASFSNNEFGTESFWTSFEALIPTDVYKQLTDVGDQIEAGWGYINDKLSRYFSYDNGSVSIGFENVKTFVEDALSTSFGDSTVFTGTLENFQLNDQITSIEQLADAMGVTTTAAFALGSAVSKYSADNADFLSSLSVDSLEGQIYAADQELVELLEHRAQLGESGQVGTEEWDNVTAAIADANAELDALTAQARTDVTKYIEIDSNIAEQQALVDDLYKKLSSMDETDANYSATFDDYVAATGVLAQLLEDKYALEAPTELTIKVALEQVQSEIDAAQAKLNEMATFDGQTYTATASVNQTEVDALVAKIDSLKAEKATIELYTGTTVNDTLSSLETIENFVIENKEFSVSADLGDTLSKLQSVINKLSSIYSKEVKVTTYTQTIDLGTTSGTNNAYGTARFNGSAYVTGNAHEKGKWGTKTAEKDALVGELGTELYVNPNTGVYQTVGEHGAELIDLPKGAIIFNHRQTEELLKNKRINSRGIAYVKGNAHFTMLDGNYNFGGGNNGSGGNYGGSGNYHENQNNNSESDIAEDAKNAFEEAYKYHQHLLEMEQEDLEHYLRWLEEAYQDAYRNGEIELDDYYKYEEEVYNGRKELFQDYLNDLEFKIAGLERMDGTEGQIINLYLGMIKDIKTEIAQARARGLDENDEYIQELLEQQRDYEDEIADIREDTTDDAKSAVEDLIEYRIKMLKQDLENERDALEDKKDALKDFYDEQKDLLQQAYDDEKTLEERNEKRKAKTDIEAELDQLKFDDSAWAQKRKLELEEELAVAQKDLDDFEKEQALDNTQDLLGSIYEKQAAQIEAEIEAIEAQLNDPEALYNRALRDIQNNTQALYLEMVEYNAKYGDGNAETVKTMWDEAKASLDDFLDTFGRAYKDIILVASPGSPSSDGYASGTRSAAPGVKKVDEKGAEWLFTSGDGTKYRVFSGGEMVLNAEATKFLYDFAMDRGNALTNMFANLLKAVNFGSINRPSAPIQLTTGDIIVQGNADMKTVSEIRRAQRENIDFVLKEFTRLNK